MGDLNPVANVSYNYLRLDLLVALAPYLAGLLACFTMLTALVALLWRQGARRRGARFAAEAGSADLEFTLAFPVFLMIILLIIQFSLLLNAVLVTDYAAFCAARSASVWQSATKDNHVADERIQRAAAVACAPISPRLSSLFGFGGGGGVSAQVDATSAPDVKQYVSAGRLGLQLLDKLLYARLFTEVHVTDANGRATAEVTHRFVTDIPYAGAILGRVAGARLGGFGPYAVPIVARYTMQTWSGDEAQ